MMWHVVGCFQSCMSYSTTIVQSSVSNSRRNFTLYGDLAGETCAVTQSAVEVWTRATSVITFLNARVTLQWADVPCAARNGDYFNASEPRARSCILWRNSTPENHLLMPVSFQTWMTSIFCWTQDDFILFFFGVCVKEKPSHCGPYNECNQI